jgi:hypothetical protein
MATSKRWRVLKREVDKLRREFLPDQFDPLGIYANPARVQSHARAFLVLCHAEIESYLEEWAKDIGRASEIVWNSSKRFSKPFVFLLMTLGKRLEVPTKLAVGSAKDTPQRLTDAAVVLYTEYYTRIRNNHGIKERNVLDLFGPIGVPATALGSTLLPNLDTLGSLRGEHAHHSARAIQSVLDPETEYKRVDALINELLVLDEWLGKCKRQIR